MRKAWPWISLVPILVAAVAIIAASFRPKQNALLVHCAASLRAPVEELAKQYRAETGVEVQIQYGGSQQLLAGISAARLGDLFIPAAESYLTLAKDRGEIGEVFALANMRLVLAVKTGNPKRIANLSDLLKAGIRVSLPDPDSAAAGKLARAALAESWKPLLAAAVVTKPTVTDCANDVKLGSADACLVFDAVVAQYPELEIVSIPELADARSTVFAGVLKVSAQPGNAAQFARMLAAPDRGGAVFKKFGYDAAEK